MERSELTRREMLVRSAVTATGLSLSMTMLAASRKAQAMVDPPLDPAKDNQTLNALLAAEYAAIATYTKGAVVVAADTATDAGVRDTVSKVAVHFQNQHKDHAEALKALITKNGGTPAPDTSNVTLPSTVTTTGQVIQLAADKEKGAAVAYANVMQTLSTPAAAKLVAAIGGTESQHFVVLYLLAEQLIAANASTNSKADLVVPASFIVDVGLAGSTSLDNLAALDTLLAFDPKPA